MEHLPNSALPLAEAIPVTQIKEAQFRFSNCRFEYELMIASDDMLKAIVDAGIVFQRAGLSCGQFRRVRTGRFCSS